MILRSVCFLAALATTALPAAEPLGSGLNPDHMDPSVRAQDNLYLAVNGTWLKSTEIPSDKSNYGSFIVLDDLARDQLSALIRKIAEERHPSATDEQKVADMYQSFMDEKAIEEKGLDPIRDDLDAVDNLRTHEGVARHFARMAQLGLQAPLAFSVDVDAKDSRRYLATIDQSGIGLPDRDYYLVDEGRYKDVRQAYTDYIATLFKLAGNDAGRAAEAAGTILELETALAKAQWTRVELRNPEKNYNKTAAQELANVAPGFPWAAYFAELKVDVPEVNVSQPPFAKAVGELLTKTPVGAWRDYLAFKVLDGFAPALSRPFQKAHFELHGKTLAGVPEEKSRPNKAVEAIAGAGPGDFGVLGEALGRMYVEAHFPPESKARMDQLVGHLMDAYRQSIDELSWMSPVTRAKAQEKLSKYTVKIGYPQEWRDYSTLQIKPDDLVGNLKASASYESERRRTRVNKPVDRKEWWMTPQTVNAYYSPSKNEIVFPAAILQPPFFNVEADDAVNYGAIGAVIGHEISHGFDDQGSQYDGDGNLRNWWTDEDRAAFKALTQKLVDQYAAYEPLPGRKLNGALTLGENIADLSGLAIAYKAYRLSLEGREPPVIDGFTGNQRFFMGWAQVWQRKYRDAELSRRLLVDPHSPSEYRANGTPINIDAFHEAFSTKPEDKMFKPAEDRIRIW